MNVQKVVVLLFGLSLCMGQNCQTPMAPTPQQLASPIPEGIYSGDVRFRLTLRRDLSPTQEEIELPYTEAFGPDGLPLDENNQPIRIGTVFDADYGGALATLEVSGIRSVANGIIVNYVVEMMFPTDSGPFSLSGEATDTYTLQGDAVEYRGTISVLGVKNGSTTSFTGSGIGLLE